MVNIVIRSYNNNTFQIQNNINTFKTINNKYQAAGLGTVGIMN